LSGVAEMCAIRIWMDVCLLFAPPNDILTLILKYSSLQDLKDLWTAVSPSTDSLSQFIPYNYQSILLQVFNHCGGQLFHKFSLDSSTLEWLGEISVV
jgi:hypothetical protein